MCMHVQVQDLGLSVQDLKIQDGRESLTERDISIADISIDRPRRPVTARNPPSSSDAHCPREFGPASSEAAASESAGLGAERGGRDRSEERSHAAAIDLMVRQRGDLSWYLPAFLSRGVKSKGARSDAGQDNGARDQVAVGGLGGVAKAGRFEAAWNVEEYCTPRERVPAALAAQSVPAQETRMRDAEGPQSQLRIGGNDATSPKRTAQGTRDGADGTREGTWDGIDGAFRNSAREGGGDVGIASHIRHAGTREGVADTAGRGRGRGRGRRVASAGAPAGGLDPFLTFLQAPATSRPPESQARARSAASLSAGRRAEGGQAPLSRQHRVPLDPQHGSSLASSLSEDMPGTALTQTPSPPDQRRFATETTVSATLSSHHGSQAASAHRSSSTAVSGGAWGLLEGLTMALATPRSEAAKTSRAGQESRAARGGWQSARRASETDMQSVREQSEPCSTHHLQQRAGSRGGLSARGNAAVSREWSLPVHALLSERSILIRTPRPPIQVQDLPLPSPTSPRSEDMRAHSWASSRQAVR